MIRKKSEDAVSPVIGVMLLLVVTIIIAAVVAVFASGVGMDTEPAPTTVLDVVDINGGSSTQEMEWVFMPDMSVNIGLATENEDGTYDIGGYTFKYIEETDVWLTVDDESPFEMYEEDEVMYQDWTRPKDEWKDWLTSYSLEITGGPELVKVTITSVAGDILDLKKLSVKVYNSKGEFVAECKQNTLSGTISPGESEIIELPELETAIFEGDKVEVFIYYGEHAIISEELKVSGGEE